MDLSRLLHLIEGSPDYQRLLSALSNNEVIPGAVVLDAAKPYLMAALHQQLQKPMLVVTAQPVNARKLSEQILNWFPACRIRQFPEPDVLPYERMVSDTSTELERIQALAALAGYGLDRSVNQFPLIITSAPALMSLTAPHDIFTGSVSQVSVGMEVEPLELLRKWQAIGYEVENLVEIPGTISHRGGIVDIYPTTSELPVRLEFFGNTIDSIRLFNPQSQRSVQEVASVEITPATELLALFQKDRGELERMFSNLHLSDCRAEVRDEIEQEIAGMKDRQRPQQQQFYTPFFNQGTIFDYLTAEALLVLDEPISLQQVVTELDMEAQQLHAEGLKDGEIPRNYPKPYLNWEELESKIRKQKCLVLTSLDAAESALHFNFVSAPNYTGRLSSFLERTNELRGEDRRVIIASNQASRLSELLEEKGIIAVPGEEVREVPSPGSISLLHGSLAEGWVLNQETYLFTDAELFGFVKQQRLIKKRPVSRHKLFVDILPGDYVVHIEHGIGKFLDVVTLRTSGAGKEYLVLQYAAGDRLYVPTDQIDRVSRYVGGGDRPPVLSRLGTQQWRKTKRRVKEAAEELAKELLELYASREVVTGFAFTKDTVWQQELEAAFPYVETPDQMTAQYDVKIDMEKAKPMDRLVCGDVGYGKTEVAIRAAFKAVMDNKQVAILVPTTVLAEQHLTTFRERLNAFPTRIEVMSRFKSPREQQEILDDLLKGKVDIVIGTHRLLQKDVAFKELGLLVIDEEQRFGVGHKEYLKQMRKEVDVLTLSATPIPRTLHMSLVGVRDMSTMETPPEERLPIKTYVAAYQERIVREVILRELERNGQVFFLHNRVQSIAMVAEKLQELVPEARFAVAHGRMAPEALEKVMAEFARDEIDVLVCTTIIESGLDMPNVNTLIINQADKMGLAQLYQLRGRVGRGANLAYAYFLYDSGKNLSPAAQKRLRTIYEATELGAGFNIAMKDLEIRGAGNLLGAKQSGHISAVGFSLYCRLLAEAVDNHKTRLAGEEVKPKLPAPVVDLPLSAYIPEKYVADVNTRLEIYQNLAKLEKTEQIEEVSKEFTDRFGIVPVEVDNLLYAIRTKLLAVAAGIESVITEDGQIVVRLFSGAQFNAEQRAISLPDGVKMGIRQVKLDTGRLGRKWRGVLEEVIQGLGTASGQGYSR
ncbi:transcription-repair coupling factor [Chloroflexota bacterium]